MAKGQPDFGSTAPTETIVGLSDLGELAARLGSIVTFDRRGNVIFLDDFDSGIEPWALGGSPIGWSGRWCSDRHRSGGFSIELNTKAQIGASVEMLRYFIYPTKSRLGVEMHFIHNARVTIADFNAEFYDGDYLYEAYIRLIDDTWYYLGDDHAYHSLSPTTNLIKDEMFHAFKLVFDLNTGKFVRLIVDTTVFDLSAYAIYKVESSLAPSFYIYYNITTEEYAEVARAWIDDLILTQNEP